MNVRPRRRPLAFTVLFGAFLTVSASLPQTTAPSNSSGPEIRIFIRAQNKRGEPITDLSKVELQVKTDKGQSLSVLDLHPAGSEPLTLGFLFDHSGSRRDESPGIEVNPSKELARSLIGPDDRAFVAVFGERYKVLLSPANDLGAITRAIESSRSLTLQGATAIYDTIAGICAQPAAQQTPRRALLVISDFEDNASWFTLDKALAAALKADYSIWILRVTDYWNGLSRGALRKAGSAGEQLAKATGGELLDADSKGDFPAQFDVVRTCLRSQYSLSFSTPSSLQDGKFHSLHFEVARKGVNLAGPGQVYLPAK